LSLEFLRLECKARGARDAKLVVQGVRSSNLSFMKTLILIILFFAKH